jgi:Na+/melibiose symporter-like transporter
LLIMGTTAASIPFWTWFSRKFGKKTAFLWGMLGYATALSGLFFLDLSHRPALYLLMVLYGLGNGAAVFGSWAMIADTIEYGEWKSGLRLEGIWYGIYGFFLKLGLGIGLWLAGQVLSGSGYVPNVAQSADSLLGIRLQVSLIPLAWIGVAWLLMWAYPIGAKMHQQIRAEIASGSV